MKLVEYTKDHIETGKDGKIDLMFFKLDQANNPTKEEFLKLVKDEYPHWLDKKEHNYLECGGDIGDQGEALAIMGLGKALDVWDLLTPNMMPFIPEALRIEMAGRGMVSIKVK